MSDDCGMELPKYNCHKQVWALKIAAIELDSERANTENRETDGGAYIKSEDSRYAEFKVDADYVKRNTLIVGGYYVVYKDGYKSFSPADAFEDGYSLA